MTSYKEDPEASGVVLFEKGEYKVEISKGYWRLVKEIHKKTLVIDPEKFDHAEVEVWLYKERETRERISKFKGVTHNGAHQTFVSDNAMFEVDKSEKWYTKRFVFPKYSKR